MSAQSFLVLGDTVQFLPSLGGPAVLTAPAITLVTSQSKNLASFRGITVEGNEKLWFVPCAYMNPPYTIPGMVICKIKALHGSNIAKKILENGKKVLLVGSAPFDAEFQVTVPAQKPPTAPGEPPTPDAQAMYQGKGQFIQAADSKALNAG